MDAPSEDTPDASGDALRLIAEGQLASASTCLGWKAGHRHKGVHLARKSIRRVRSILALAAAAVGPGADALDHLLSGINRGLSPLRDAQALVEAIDHFTKQTRDTDRRALLRRARNSAVSARRVVLKQAMAGDPDFVGVREVLDRTRDALQDLAWGEVTISVLRSAFAQSRKSTRKAARRAVASGKDQDWHRWRRKARRQSQQQRLLGEVGIKTMVRYGDKDIAVLLGQQQDCTLLLAFCESGPASLRRADRKRLHGYIERKLRSLRKTLARQSVRR